MKLLLLFLFFLSSIVAETTLCYKKNTTSISLDKTALLNGTDCQGKLSILTMGKNNWEVSDTKVIKENEFYNHIVIFTKKSKDDITNTFSKSTYYSKVFNKIDLNAKQVKIYDLSRNTARIKIKNLKIGQSGAVIHHSTKEDSIIIAIAEVIETNSEYSTIRITKKSILKQDAIPTSKYIASKGDTFILNHMYSSSLLIVPNSKAKAMVVLNYPNQKFLSEDFFASYLKVINTPILNKKNIINFAKSQQVGTIFIVIKNTLYVKDALTFKTIDKIALNINDSTTKVPFYSKIMKIEKGLLDFGDDKIENYNKHYLALVDNTTYSNNIGKSLFHSVKEIFTW